MSAKVVSESVVAMVATARFCCRGLVIKRNKSPRHKRRAVAATDRNSRSRPLNVGYSEKLVVHRLFTMLIRVSTNEGRPCPLCGQFLDGTEEFEEACKHLEGHGLKRLHVGQETHHGGDAGAPWHSTVAVFGD